MAAFSRTQFAKRLQNLSLSQQKIINLSKWIIEHKFYYRTIVKIWFKELITASEDQKLNFLYLANEIIQSTKKKIPEYGKEFDKYLLKVFKHLSGLENYDKKFKKDVKRILQIWEDRKVFDKDEMILLKNVAESTASNEQEERIHADVEDFDFGQLDDIFPLSPNPARLVARPTDELVKAFKALKHPASCDAKVRHEIVSLPEDVAKLETLSEITSIRLAKILNGKVNYALKLTGDYNERLKAELEDRQNLIDLLKDYTVASNEIQRKAKERLQRYKMKLVKIQKLRKDIRSHVHKLPDMRKLPVLKGKLDPLPTAGDLFKPK